MHTFESCVTTPDGNMNCFFAVPQEDGGVFPSVILYTDVLGIRDELRDFARRIAAAGNLCVLPDLYYREGNLHFGLSKGEGELARMFAAGSGLTNAMILRDTASVLSYLESLTQAGPRTGVIGCCTSGQFVVSAAGAYPARIKACASLYGVRIVTDKADSPHRLVGNIAPDAALYLGFAENDPYVGESVIPTLAETLDRHGVEYTLQIHPGTEHGFWFPERPQHNEPAAERVWDALLELFRCQLHP